MSTDWAISPFHLSGLFLLTAIIRFYAPGPYRRTSVPPSSKSAKFNPLQLMASTAILTAVRVFSQYCPGTVAAEPNNPGPSVVFRNA